ncbi:MAG: DUF1326 domain-containing protein [Candidatus Binataceae bacterium]
MSTPAWRIQADYMESCNCDFGCPCNFNGIPSGGYCQALVGMHVRHGHYGEINLDGLDFVFAGSWPRAIHQGDGTACVYITETASTSQREALAEITQGRAGGSGPFAIFSQTMLYMLAPQFVPIRMNVDGKRSVFSVPGILNVELTPHIDPVSGNERQVELNLPDGFMWKSAQAVKTAAMKILTSNLSFDHSGRNAFYAMVDYQGP